MYKQVIHHANRRSDRSKRILAEARSFRLQSGGNAQIVENFYITLDTPVSLSCYLLYKYKEFDQLVSKEVKPDHYNDPFSFRNDFAAISLLRKSSSLKTSFDKKSVALDTFKAAEESCKQTNSRIKDYLNGWHNTNDCEWLINSAIRKIDRILGEFSVDEFLDSCRWGPGVSLKLKGNDTSAARKFDHESEVTRDAYALFGEVMTKAYPQWKAFENPSFVPGNSIITVPKNAKTDRTIAVEPGLNIWIQLGIGKSIRKRLRWAGYNLNSDLKNQRGAYLGSVYDNLATVDFKAASDTISSSVVELLLPKTWYTILDAARSHYYNLNGKTQRFEKFSTMGNGFTFELESLIFVSLALACCELLGVDDSNVSVFGDDIILPSDCVDLYTSLCSFLGFTVNTTKSYSKSCFRESCGSYYFDGVDVKPIFLKKDLLYVKDLFRMANAITSYSHRCNFCCSRDVRFLRIWSLVIHRLPISLRLFGPLSAGDSAIHVNLSEANVKRAPNGWCGFNYAGLIEVPLSLEKESLGLLLAKLSQTSQRDVTTDIVGISNIVERLEKVFVYVGKPSNNSVPLRARVRMQLKKSMFTHLWYELGDWTTF